MKVRSIDRQLAMHRGCMPIGLILLITAMGCAEKGPKRAPVVGTVRFQSKPVVGASVTFTPVDKGARSATGTTDDQGNFRLETVGMGEGAILGKHLVCMSLRGTPPPPDPKQSQLPPMAQKRALGKPLIPIKYFTPENSGLTAEVADISENRFDFELTP